MTQSENATHYIINGSKYPKSRYTHESAVDAYNKWQLEQSLLNDWNDFKSSLSLEDSIKSDLFLFARRQHDGYTIYIKSEFSPTGKESARSGSITEVELLLNKYNRNGGTISPTEYR